MRKIQSNKIKNTFRVTSIVFSLLLFHAQTSQASCSPPGAPVTCIFGTDTFNNPLSSTVSSLFINYPETLLSLTNAGIFNVGGISSATDVTVNLISNTGTIQGLANGVAFSSGGHVGTLTNSESGLITTARISGIRIGNNTTFANIVNGGTISGGVSGISFGSSGVLGVLTNTGVILNSISGVNNRGVNLGAGASITTFNNAQGGNGSSQATTAVTYGGGALPSNYNIIINSPTYYGQLSVSSVRGSMAFNIYGNTGTTLVSGVATSTVAAGTYAGVLQGFSSLSGITGTTGTYGSLNYSLIAGSTSGFWDLVFQSPLPNITGAGVVYQSSGVGITFNPVFDGGTLQISNTAPNTSNYTVNALNGVIDQNGLQTNFSGVISNAVSGTPGSMTVINTGTGGAVVFSNTNTYTGLTTVNSGATLALSGAGSIATSSGVVDNGTFDISNTTSGASIRSLTGSGAVALGGQTLAITNAAGTFSGGIGGTGGILNITGGSQTLTGVSSYTGSTGISSGATLTLSGVGSIATSSSVANSGTFDISATTSGASVQAISGSGAVVLGAQTLAITNASGDLAGAIEGAGGLNVSGGTQTLSGANIYTGSTAIGAGATLALSGTGSVATSSSVTNSGTFDISNASTGVYVQAISGAGATTLGSQNLTIANASGNLSGTVTGSGSINIAAGSQTLSGNNANSFTGGVQVQSGASLTIPTASALGSGTLALIGSSSVPATLNVTGTTNIANPITVTGDPNFNISSGTTTTVSTPITNGSSAGDVVVQGGGTLALTAANTYAGLTSVAAGSTLALSGAGSIAASSSVTNNGTFNIASKTSNISVATYTQGSTGTLAMGFAPTNNPQLNVAGATSIAGSLVLTATAGTYAAGRYTLITSAGGLTGTFGTLTSNLSSYTTLASMLSYDANDVFLILFMNGPSAADTQQSLVNNAAALQNIFTLQNTVLANSFSYDCTEFGANNICVSAGGRNTAVSAANGLNNSSALLIAAYRVMPNVRIGAYADQNLSMNQAGNTVNLGNNTPLIGLFGAWNERLNGTGA
jgi:autotransporter-associated beta strand protein